MYVGYLLPDTRYHITMTFHGYEETKQDFKRAVAVTAKAALYLSPFVAIMSGDIEKFGATEKWWVTLVDSPKLCDAQAWLTHHMYLAGVEYSDEFAYRPHITMTKYKKPKQGLTGELLIDRLHIVSKEHGTSEVLL